MPVFSPQVINGLMERSDWEQAIKTPVGILPCGSGNALAGSINHHAGYACFSLIYLYVRLIKILFSSQILLYIYISSLYFFMKTLQLLE